ncbi:hypothetical protein IFR05_015807 [Cadophora sp. M221]|nr:hypothetical protein IFR05_015807 [Cadophora sp. M221]
MAQSKSKNLSGTSHLINVLDNRMSVGTDTDLIRDISTKLILNPSQKLTYEDLYRGNYKGASRITNDGYPVINTCEDDQGTPQADKIQRRKLIKGFNAPSTSTGRKLEIVRQLDKTYRSAPSQAPRFEMWDLHMSLVEVFAKNADTDEIIQHVLAAFTSVGFVIEGARISPFPSTKIVVRKWGAPHDGATSAWLSLRNVYKAFGLTELADQAKEFARITWLLLAGEDTTFVYDNPPNNYAYFFFSRWELTGY